MAAANGAVGENVSPGGDVGVVVRLTDPFWYRREIAWNRAAASSDGGRWLGLRGCGPVWRGWRLRLGVLGGGGRRLGRSGYARVWWGFGLWPGVVAGVDCWRGW